MADTSLFGTPAVSQEMQELFEQQQEDILAQSGVVKVEEVDEEDEIDNSPEAIRGRILQSVALGMSLEDACIAEGVDDWASDLAEDKVFQKALRTRKAQLEAEYLRALMSAAAKAATNGQTRPVESLLATLNPEKYGKDAKEQQAKETRTPKGLKIQFVTKDRPLPAEGGDMFDPPKEPSELEQKIKTDAENLNLDI